MEKRLLKVVFYPSPEGKMTFASPNEIAIKIGVSRQTHDEDFHIIHAEMPVNGITSVIDRALLEKKKVDLVLWNPMPEEEIEKLKNYNLDFNNVCICSVNHNFQGGSEEESYEQKLERLLQKRKN